jgi:hypothetical protein
VGSRAVRRFAIKFLAGLVLTAMIAASIWFIVTLIRISIG